MYLYVKDGDNWWFRMSPPSAFASVAQGADLIVNGVKLTVASLDTNQYLVNLASAHTKLHTLEEGETVEVKFC